MIIVIIIIIIIIIIINNNNNNNDNNNHNENNTLKQKTVITPIQKPQQSTVRHLLKISFSSIKYLLQHKSNRDRSANRFCLVNLPTE